jgi:hypothetical protein
VSCNWAACEGVGEESPYVRVCIFIFMCVCLCVWMYILNIIYMYVCWVGG